MKHLNRNRFIIARKLLNIDPVRERERERGRERLETEPCEKSTKD